MTRKIGLNQHHESPSVPGLRTTSCKLDPTGCDEVSQVGAKVLLCTASMKCKEVVDTILAVSVSARDAPSHARPARRFFSLLYSKPYPNPGDPPTVSKRVMLDVAESAEGAHMFF